MDYSRLEDTSNRQFSVALISRNYGKDGDWIVRIGNGAGDEIASFHLKNSEYDEKNNIISLSECNNSGVFGYAIVDWSVIENHTENTFSFSPITNSAFDLSIKYGVWIYRLQFFVDVQISGTLGITLV